MAAPQLKWNGNFALDVLAIEFNRMVKRAANELETAVKQEAPVDTGFLRDSVHSFPLQSTGGGRKFVSFQVVVDAFYAGYVNFGTSRQRPNPFFQRGLNRALPRIRDAFTPRGRITSYRVGTAIGRLFGLRR